MASLELGAVEYDFLVKLVCVGNSGVGKSSLIHRYSRREFNPHFVSTIGVDFEIKEIDVLDKKVKLQLWDCAGNERFRTITTSYYRGAHVVMLVFDVTDESSIYAIPDWIREIRLHNHEAPILLVGNKIDTFKSSASSSSPNFVLPNDIHVTIQQLEPSLSCSSCMLLTSAKQNTNVDAAFVQLTTQHIKERLANPIVTSSKHTGTIHLGQTDQNMNNNGNSSSCCLSS